MPLDESAGFSADTAVKQRDFGYVLGVLLKVAQSCMQRSWAHGEFLYFDMNAGPGVVGGIEGSPLIFVKTALEIGLPFRAFFFEEKRGNADRLQVALESACPESQRDRLKVIVGDHNWTVPWALKEHLATVPRKWVYGLGYGDGNGKTDAPFGPMEALAARFPQTDLVLNVNATVYKRERGGNPSAAFLLDHLGSIDKAHCLIRRPVGIHQWTMLFLTNWIGAPEFEQIGFRALGSLEGREIAARVNFSKREVAGSPHPFGLSLPTEAMPSTSDTRSSSPSGRSSLSGAAASASDVTGRAPQSPIT